MKKSSIFVLIVTFIISIFLINFYGLSVRTDHMKSYIKNVSMDSLTLINTGESIEFKTAGKIKYARVNFALAEEGSLSFFIEHTIDPETAESDTYEFVILSGNEEFEVIEDEEVRTYYYAELAKNKLVINHVCSLVIELRALDGSGRSDKVTIICMGLS